MEVIRRIKGMVSPGIKEVEKEMEERAQNADTVARTATIPGNVLKLRRIGMQASGNPSVRGNENASRPTVVSTTTMETGMQTRPN